MPQHQGRANVVQSNPTAAVVVAIGFSTHIVTRQVLGLAAGGHTQNSLLRTDRHQDVFVAPIGDIDIKHIFGGGGKTARGIPSGMQGFTIGANKTLSQRTGGAVDGLIELPVAVAKVIQRHVAGGVEHRPFLRIAKLGEGTVTGCGVITGGPVRSGHTAGGYLLVASIVPIGSSHHMGIGRR